MYSINIDEENKIVTIDCSIHGISKKSIYSYNRRGGCSRCNNSNNSNNMRSKQSFLEKLTIE